MNHVEWIAVNTRFVRVHVQDLIDANCPYPQWFEDCGPQYVKSPRYHWVRRLMRKHLKDGMTVLDVGGGLGAFGTYYTTVLNRHFKYVNIEWLDFVDLTQQYFEAFNLQWDGHQAIQLDALTEEIPFEPDTFDIVWMFGWYDSRVGFPKLFPEIFNLLKPGGMFFFNVLDTKAKPPGSKRTISRDALEGMLIKFGYDILSLHLVPGDNDYLVMCGKPK